MAGGVTEEMLTRKALDSWSTDMLEILALIADAVVLFEARTVAVTLTLAAPTVSRTLSGST